MSKTAIRAQNLGKLYSLELQRGYRDLCRTLTEVTRASVRAVTLARGRGAAGCRPSPKRNVWALRNVSFEVKQGDAVGIMGDNGGGKTTLLRVFSRITYPTEGRVEIRGRVGTLLDVGAGLHGELTGRENVYLNGAVKGMARVEVKSKFDEIVAFAELQDFIDTPLKHYSAGTCARLAFAVAAHLESEILMVDEVLAAADTKFQNKCQEKLLAAVREGRTLLFVSHDLEHIRQLCNRGIVLARGRIVCSGPASEAVDYYRSISGGALQNQASMVKEVL